MSTQPPLDPVNYLYEGINGQFSNPRFVAKLDHQANGTYRHYIMGDSHEWQDLGIADADRALRLLRDAVRVYRESIKP